MINKKLIGWSLIVALAGFLFGFDTIVINGAEETLQEKWAAFKLFGDNDLFHGIVVVGSALWGTVVGALFGGIPSNKLGRKNTLILIGVLYVVSALGSAFVDQPWLFAAFRFLGGLGVGASTIAAPAYVSEIAPAKDRGKLVALYQFNIVFGILVAFVTNALIGNSITNDAWRWMIGIEAIPAFLYTMLVFTVPKSPRWLITAKGAVEEAKAILFKIDPSSNIEDLVGSIQAEQNQQKPNETIFDKKYKFPLGLAFAIAFFNQFSGINALLYYATRIFNEAGLAEKATDLGTIGIGITNLVFTLLGILLIDRMGRKKLLLIGSVGYIISLSLVAAAFYFGWAGIIVPILLFVFIAAHAVGQGAVIWVFISEIFPNHIRSAGQSFGTSTHWWLAAIIPSLVPILFTKIGAWPVFAFFAFMMVLQLLWVIFIMPETKGVSLEDLQKKLTGKR